MLHKLLKPAAWVECAAILIPGCGPSTDKNSDSDQGRDTTVENDTSICVTQTNVNTEACSALCESKNNQTDCEAVSLTKPETEEYIFFGHGCRWYDAREVSINDLGECVFGESHPICGYAASGDIQCGGNGLWCEGWEFINHQEGAGYYVADGKTFLFRDSCAAMRAGSIHQCAWSSPVDIATGIPECACACDMEPDAGVDSDTTI